MSNQPVHGEYAAAPVKSTCHISCCMLQAHGQMCCLLVLHLAELEQDTQRSLFPNSMITMLVCTQALSPRGASAAVQKNRQAVGAHLEAHQNMHAPSTERLHQQGTRPAHVLWCCGLANHRQYVHKAARPDVMLGIQQATKE